MGGKKRKSRKQRGGMGYGFGGTVGTAGPVWNQSWGGEITKSGEPIYDTADRPPVTGGKRRRKTRKGKSRRRATRRMRGGGSVANVGYGFAGTGARGIADAVGYPSNLPPAGFPIPTGTR
jgi:hypothetical protein